MKAGILLMLAMLAIPLVSAATPPFYTVEPSAATYREGSTLRVCTDGHPDTDQATHTFPDATTEVLTTDSNHCFAFTLTQAGTHTLDWTVATNPFTFTVEAWAPAETDWDWWMTFAFLSLVIIMAMRNSWILVGAFGLIGIFAFALEVMAFDFKGTLAFILLAFALEWTANKWRLSKNTY